MPLPGQDAYTDTLKLIQIVFYTSSTILAVLTYRAAKRGLLNTVNTEYQKRVMDRLQKLSEDLYSEFDPSSPTHWVKNKAVDDAIRHINEAFERHREHTLAERKYPFGIPVTNETERIHNLLHPVVSDLFIPENIRESVIDLLQNRLMVLSKTYYEELEKYANSLAKGKREPIETLEERNAIYNRMVEQLNEQGYSIAQIEEAVHGIRRLIQDYFASFNPHRRWWDRKQARR